MITRQPTNETIIALQDVTFTCEAKGFDVKYEWKRHSGDEVTGRRKSTLTISRATPLDSDQYYCVAMTKGKYAFSNNVTLTVNGENHHNLIICSKTIAITFIGYIDITSHPQSVTVAKGDMLSLSVTADGPGKDMFEYQWKKKGGSLSKDAGGKKSPTLSMSSVQSSDSGSYHCVVMNQWGNMTKSDEAIVKVLCKSHLCIDIMCCNIMDCVYKGWVGGRGI